MDDLFLHDPVSDGDTVNASVGYAAVCVRVLMCRLVLFQCVGTPMCETEAAVSWEAQMFPLDCKFI